MAARTMAMSPERPSSPAGEGGLRSRSDEGTLGKSPILGAAPNPSATPTPSPTRGEGALFRLLTWLSPSFPVGAFGWSHGLEQAIADGTVTDAATLTDWITGLVEMGSGWSDAVLFAEAHAAADDPDRLAEAADLAAAMAVSAERHAETLGQGTAFLNALVAWPDIRANLPADAPYCIAVGAACGLGGVAGEQALTAWLHAFAANLVSVALRAIPLGQSQGVRVLAGVEPVILATAARAAVSTLDDLGSCAILSDIAAMRHETLQPRLFLS